LVYLPAGQWIDFWTGAVIAGGQEIQTAAPLDTLPLYGQAGTMIPWGPAHDFITDEPDRAMSFKVFGDAASYDHYQDNGYDFAYQKGEFNQYHITFAQGKAAVTLTKAGYPAGLYSRITVTAGDQSFALQLENGKYQRIDKN
jgi:alpha-glucosidase